MTSNPFRQVPNSALAKVCIQLGPTKPQSLFGVAQGLRAGSTSLSCLLRQGRLSDHVGDVASGIGTDSFPWPHASIPPSPWRLGLIPQCYLGVSVGFITGSNPVAEPQLHRPSEVSRLAESAPFATRAGCVRMVTLRRVEKEAWNIRFFAWRVSQPSPKICPPEAVRSGDF
ncbi:hypothetical protein N7492_004704 [Penicillium capsulatum]|uniref:Uncharacterized protein n=1 Tax=Penicillium capsulatum TaxID=69766 RepID=A0A9W9IAV6_9EURO|nr:hypothetical protein N7492_004704 [Penicillium capsulatum]